MTLEDFFNNFDEMFSPEILKVAFSVGVLISTFFNTGIILFGFLIRGDTWYGNGTIAIIKGLIPGSFGGVFIFGGIIGLVLVPIILRLWCERRIVIFEIHSNLVELNRNTAKVESNIVEETQQSTTVAENV